MIRTGITIGLVFLEVGCSDRATNEPYATVEPPVTFCRDIAPIVFDHCVVCHRAGQSAPFSLTTFDDVASRSRQIMEVTANRYMPPWMPESGKGHFANDRSLSDQQIDTIRRWVESGCVEGDRLEIPALPQFPKGWRLGPPDLVVRMAEPFELSADGTDVFRNFVLPIPNKQTQYVKAVELRPDNERIVHHAVMMVDATRASRDQDRRDAEPGFGGMFATNARHPDGTFLGWTPGNTPNVEDERYAWRLNPGTDLVLQVHMQPTGRPESFGASVGFYFSESPATHSAVLIRLGRRNLDIPAGDAEYTMQDQFVLPVDVNVLSVYPHAHYLGKQMEAWATLPGGDSRWLIRIADWDVNWQDDYHYAQPVYLPRGTRLSIRFQYDNSAANIRNPHHPPQRVVIGPNATDEMGDLLLRVVPKTRKAAATLKRQLAQKDAIEDLNCYQTLVAARPDEADNHIELGIRYRNIGQLDKARLHFERAISLTPNSDVAHTNLGGVLGVQKRLDQAERHLRIAIRLSANNPTALNNLGQVLYRQRKISQAIAYYQRALLVSPDYAMAHYNLGLAWLAAKQPDKAIDQFRQTVRIRPDLPGVTKQLQAAERMRQAQIDANR